MRMVLGVKILGCAFLFCLKRSTLLRAFTPSFVPAWRIALVYGKEVVGLWNYNYLRGSLHYPLLETEDFAWVGMD
jgi:hypothetical protein